MMSFGIPSGRMTVSTALDAPPDTATAVTVITVAPGFNGTRAIVQLVEPKAAPASPRSVAQVTRRMPDEWRAAPLSATVAAFIVSRPAGAGERIVTTGGVDGFCVSGAEGASLGDVLRGGVGASGVERGLV